jgi:putative transcriptional regulator
MDPEAGALLVASPELTDPNFAKSVVFLLEHGDHGTLGFIINRPLELTLKDIWREVPRGLAQCRIAAEGGPVERGQGLLIHGCLDLSGAQVVGSVAIGGDPSALAARFAQGQDADGPRLFLGHSGWMPGQLSAEMRAGAWQVRSPAPGVLFDNLLGEDFWHRLYHGPGHGMAQPSLN